MVVNEAKCLLETEGRACKPSSSVFLISSGYFAWVGLSKGGLSVRHPTWQLELSNLANFCGLNKRAL